MHCSRIPTPKRKFHTPVVDPLARAPYDATNQGNATFSAGKRVILTERVGIPAANQPSSADDPSEAGRDSHIRAAIRS